MNGGIDQLVDTYKGNPQPLNAQVQKAQQNQPPGEIPADLEEALALQEIAELRTGAQNQQAIQAGGAQPSVVDKLRQMLAGNQAQAQMAPPAQGAPAPQGQPVMAARGGSIDQLMSNLGRHYAGGGIIAFNGEENNNPVEDPNADKRSLIEKLLYSNITPAEQQRRAALQAAAEERSAAPIDGFPQQTGPKENMGSLIEKLLYSNLTPAEQRRRAALQTAANERAGISAPVPPTTLSNRAALNAADAGLRSQSGASNRALLNAADADLRSQPAESAPAAVKPTGAGVAGAGAGGSGAAPQNVDPDSLDAITRKYLKGEFAVNPETERDKAVNWARQTMGLDGLLGEKERRANAREGAIRNIEAKRTPAWVEGLANARKQTRGGIGSLIGQMGDTADTVRQGYEMQSLAFQKELDQLRDVIVDAKISGNKELVKEGMAAYKEVDARRRAAAQSSTSLLNTDATNAMRLQTAREGAANRAQIAAAQLEGKKSERQQRQQNWIAEQERKWQDTLNKSPAYKEAVNLRSMYERQLNTSTNPKIQEQAQAAIDLQNEKIAKMLPTAGGVAANIPPPPPGAVRETVKKS